MLHQGWWTGNEGRGCDQFALGGLFASAAK